MGISVDKIGNNFNHIPLNSPKKEILSCACEQNNEIGNIPAYYHPSFLGKKEKISREDILNEINKNRVISSKGLKGDVYRLDKYGKSYAIKVAKDRNNDFSNEAKVLKALPKEIDGQKFVDYFKDEKTGKDILVSTFVQGKSGILSDEESFKNFFKNLSLLDEKGILHGDLNMNNCLFDKDKVNFIDFGEGSFFEPFEKASEPYPSFILKNNLINFEHNGIQDCIQGWQDTNVSPKEAFVEYLKAKGEYYSYRVKNLNGLKNKSLENSISYEENYAEILKDPSLEVIKNEARRMDLLYTFEQADTAVNYEKNPNGAIKNWNLTIKKADRFLENIDEILNNENLKEEEKTYFRYQRKIGESLKKCFDNWGNSTKDWVKRSLIDPKSEHEREFVKNKDKEPVLVPDIYSMVF